MTDHSFGNFISQLGIVAISTSLLTFGICHENPEPCWRVSAGSQRPLTRATAHPHSGELSVISKIRKEYTSRRNALRAKASAIAVPLPAFTIATQPDLIARSYQLYNRLLLKRAILRASSTRGSFFPISMTIRIQYQESINTCSCTILFCMYIAAQQYFSKQFTRFAAWLQYKKFRHRTNFSKASIKCNRKFVEITCTIFETHSVHESTNETPPVIDEAEDVE